MTPETLKAIAAITDEGMFERLATAVLRQAEPLCAAVCHVGITVGGKTKKSPLDGIDIVPDGTGQRLVAIHHTTTAIDGLERKWLDDPRSSKTATAAKSKPNQKSKANGSSTRPSGDVIKTADLVANERKRTPKLRATLFLTTTEEPSEQLIRDVKAVAARRKLDVKIWSRSQIAHFLDVDPTGQWIRQSFLQIEAQRLSPELLRALSIESVRKPPPHERPSTWVDRALDVTVATIRAPLTYVGADSGLGKTVACYRALKAHVDAGGYGIRLSHSLVESSATLERAVVEALRQLHPSLAEGQNPFGPCSSDQPLFILVEDVNRSAQPHRLIEKIAGWALPTDEVTRPWRVICPVWPRLLGLVTEQVRKAIERVTIYATALSPDESRRAVIRQVQLCGHAISDVDADNIAIALGHDPLLIGLHDYQDAPHPHEVIGKFVEHALQRAEGSTGVLAPDMHAALMSLAAAMLAQRCLEPTWREVEGLHLGADAIEALRAVIANAEVVRLSGANGQHRLQFRHDRVRDWLLIESATCRDAQGFLPDEIVADPFYAEILGAVAVRRACERGLLSRLRHHNPLALFYALRLLGNQRSSVREVVYEAIAAWLQEPDTRAASNSYLRWQAIIALASTDGADIPALVRLVPDNHSYRYIAALHNGDVDAGVKACARYEFGTAYAFLERQIEHVRLRFGGAFVAGVKERLHRGESRFEIRRGLIELCGRLGDPSLVEGLEALWHGDSDRAGILQSYLWAFARCCSDLRQAERNLGPICDAWAALPNRAPHDHRPSPRDDFAAHGVEWALRRQPPTEAALRYLVSRASDPELRWPITYVLNGIDHPVALEWVVRYVAEQIKADKRRIHLGSGFVDVWREDRRGVGMSELCRGRLRNLWTNRKQSAAIRRAAFAFWSANAAPDDVSILRGFRGDKVLGEALLAQRLVRGDTEAVPELIPRLRQPKKRYWWSWAHNVLTPEVIEEVDRALSARRKKSRHEWYAGFDGDRDLTDLLTRMPLVEAERRVLAHWDHLQYSRRFVQLALFLATEELRSAAHRSIMDGPEPSKMLEHVSDSFGVHWGGRPGITREEQILQLEPYLDLLSEHDRNDLAQACSENGWLETRRRFFDKHINQQRIVWKPEAAPSEFDEMIARERIHWIDHEIEMALKTGATWAEYLSALSAWFHERRSFAALRLLAGALMGHGSRADLNLLQVHDGMPESAAKAVIADVTFAVRRRSLA